MGKAEGRSKWGWVRLGVLVFFLLATGIFAIREYRYQHRGFSGPQRFVVLIAVPEGLDLSEASLSAFRALKPAVEEKLANEISFHSGAPAPSVEIFVTDPVALSEAVPTEPEDGLLELVRYNFRLDSFVTTLVRKSGFRARFDTVLVLVATPGDPLTQSIEGISQSRGHYGIIQAELTPESADFAWFVTIHEYLHTRGATDKYDSSNAASFPDGFAEPDKTPLYPQTYIELMARGRPTDEGRTQPPGPPATWRIGERTAREIGLKK